MSLRVDTKFITFMGTLINVADISWSQVYDDKTFYDDDKPWTMVVHFRGVSQSIPFNFKTQREAQGAHNYFSNLVYGSNNE